MKKELYQKYGNEIDQLVVSTRLKHLLVKLDHLPRNGEKNEECLKPPPEMLFLFFSNDKGTKSYCPGSESYSNWVCMMEMGNSNS